MSDSKPKMQILADQESHLKDYEKAVSSTKDALKRHFSEIVQSMAAGESQVPADQNLRLESGQPIDAMIASTFQ